MEFLKDTTDSLLQRARSPIAGSVVFAFFVINWRPVWYLFFADEPAAIKLRFFDLNSSWKTLYFWPIIVGVLIAIAAPWIKLIGVWLALRPTSILGRMRFDRKHEDQIYQNNRLAAAEEAAANLEAAKERRVIDAAKRLEEAGDVANPEVVDKLIEERNKGAEAKVEKITISSEARNLLMKLASSRAGMLQVGEQEGANLSAFIGDVSVRVDSRKMLLKLISAKDELVKAKLITDGQQNYVTDLGYQIADFHS